METMEKSKSGESSTCLAEGGTREDRGDGAVARDSGRLKVARVTYLETLEG